MDQGRRELGTETDYVDGDPLHLELISRIPIMLQLRTCRVNLMKW